MPVKHIKVLVDGNPLIIPFNTRCEDLMEILRLNREAYLPIIGGKPCPDDRYLNDGDEVRLIRITIHEEPVARDEKDL